MTEIQRRRVRQRMVEVLAAEMLRIPKGTLAAWRMHGRVPHQHRIPLLGFGEEAGLALDAPRDFENWQRVSVR